MRGVTRLSGARSAVAIEAPVFGAGAAGADDLFAEGLAGSVDTDGGVVGSNAGLGSKVV